LTFETPTNGPTVRKSPTRFTVSVPPGALTVHDGIDAVVASGGANFVWPSFDVAVLGGTVTLSPTDVRLALGQVAEGADVRVTRIPETLVATIALGNAPDSDRLGVSWNGLTLSSDIPGQITITGTPQRPWSQLFRVFVKSSATSSVVVASADFTVHVTSSTGFSLEPDVVTIAYDETAYQLVRVDVDPTLTLDTLTMRRLGRNPSSDFEWNGLRIVADAAAPRITISGTPNVESGTLSVDVIGTFTQGATQGLSWTVPLTVTITPPQPTPPAPPEPTYRLSLSPATLHPIAEKEFAQSATVSVVASPSSALAVDLTGLTIDGLRLVNWNGLTLVAGNNYGSIEVYGQAEAEGSKSFLIEGSASVSVTSARLTVTVHPAEEESRTRGRFLDVSGEILVENGTATSLAIPCLSYVTVDSVTEVNPDGKWQWIQGPTPEGVDEIYVSVHPTTAGLYTLRINYSLGGTAYYENVRYRSVTNEEDSGSGGCSATGPMGLGVLALGVLGLWNLRLWNLRLRNRRR
jgi:hypothetical protein